MASLTGTKIKDTYDALLKVSDNGALDGTLQTITDGLGNNSALSLSTAGASVGGTLAVSGNAAFDTNTLFVDAANNRVGVGTASPNSSLQFGNIAETRKLTLYEVANNDYQFYGFGIESNTFLYSVGDLEDRHVFFAGSGTTTRRELMRIYGTGDVSFRDSSANEAFYWDASAASLGIGGVPSYALDVNVSTDGDWAARVKNTSSTGYGLYVEGSENSSQYILGLNNGISYQMVVKGNGDVGIGVTNPLQKLSVSDGTNAFGVTHDASGPYLISANNANTVYKSLRYDALDHQFLVSASERVRVTSSGLTFNGDTAAANALDDYEEGTWTMGVSFGGASVGVTYGANVGTYTKIGRQVTAMGYLIVTNKGSSTGVAEITGLPYTIGATASFYPAVSVGYLAGISFADTLMAFGEINTTRIPLFETTNGGVSTQITDADFVTANYSIIFTITYFTA